MELIKLKIKRQAVKDGNSQLIIDSFKEACVKLDTSIIEPLLNEDQYFEEKDKFRFLAFLNSQFDYAKSIGNDRTTMRYGKCGLCELGHITHEWFGADGKILFAYIIQQKDGEIQDIFNCNASSGWFEKWWLNSDFIMLSDVASLEYNTHYGFRDKIVVALLVPNLWIIPIEGCILLTPRLEIYGVIRKLIANNEIKVVVGGPTDHKFLYICFASL